MRKFGLAAAVLILTFYLAPVPAHALFVNWSFSQDATALPGGSASTIFTGTNPLQSPLTVITDFSASQSVIPQVTPNAAVTCTSGPGIAHCVSALSPQGSVSINLLWGPLSAGTFNITVTINDNTGPPGVATGTTFVAGPSQPVNLAFLAQPTTTIAGATINPAPQVAIQDASGNPTQATGLVTIQLAGNLAGATLSGPTTANATNGQAIFSGLSLDKAGSGYRLTVSSPGLIAATSNGFDVIPGSAASLAITTGPALVDAGSALTVVTIVINDRLGNLVTSATNSVTAALGANPGGSTLSGTTTLPAVNGEVAFRDLSVNKVGSGYTLVFTSPSLTGVTSKHFDVTAAAPAQLTFTVPPSDVQAGQPISPPVTVAIEDPFGNLTQSTSSVTIAIGANPGAATLSGTTTADAINGLVSFSNLSLSKPGTGYTLVASGSGLNLATSSLFNVTPALVRFHLEARGLPDVVPHVATFDSLQVELPFTTFVVQGSTHEFHYPFVVAGLAGVRYFTADLGMKLTVDSAFTDVADYRTQYLLSVTSNPAVMNVFKSWEFAGTTAEASAPSFIYRGPFDRYRFDHWSGDASGSQALISVYMNAPVSLVANYVLQHELSIGQAGLPNGVGWQIQVNFTPYFGPYDNFLDDGTMLVLSAQEVVMDDSMTAYLFRGFTPAPPPVFTQAFATVAQYETVGQIFDAGLASGVISGPGARGLVNSYEHQWAAFERSAAAGQTAAALGDLQSFLCHLQAQSGKKLAISFVAPLASDVTLLYEILSQGLAPSACK